VEGAGRRGSSKRLDCGRGPIAAYLSLAGPLGRAEINRSGMTHAGVSGGSGLAGDWKADKRFLHVAVIPNSEGTARRLFFAGRFFARSR